MPLFVSFEGGEGVGKTTQATLLRDRLWNNGHRASLVHEPGTTPLGLYLREYLKSGQPLTKEAELLLFEASRVELVNQRIMIDLQNGFHIISDRFEASTIAYQGYGRRMSLSLIEDLNRFATHGVLPHITFLLDLDPAEGLRRVGNPQLMMDLDLGTGFDLPRLDIEGQRRYEEEPLIFHRRVREGFQQLAANDLDRWIVMDASQSEDQIAELVWEQVVNRLKSPVS
jgi:dTMP kinase